MYPNLSYLLHDLIGTDPDNWTSIFQTFGLFMALAFLSAAVNLYSELRRKEKQGLMSPVQKTIKIGEPASVIELIWNGFLGFLFGFKLLYIFQNFPEFKADAPGVILSSKGSMIGGIVMAIIFFAIKYWEKNKDKLDTPKEKLVNFFPSDQTGDITIVAAITGLTGAKVFALMETPAQFFADPIGQLFSGSGLAIYGGLIGGAIGVIAYLLFKKISVPHFADAVAPGLILSYGVGRMGCQMSGDGDWGIPVKGPYPKIESLNYDYDFSQAPSWMSWLPDWFYAYDYPHNVNQDGGAARAMVDGCEWEYCARLDVPVFSTPIWEIMASFAIFGILWAIRKRITIPGMLFCVYLVFNGIERYWIEAWRVNDHYDWLPFEWTQAELIAVMLMVLGVGLGFYLWMKGKGNSSGVAKE